MAIEITDTFPKQPREIKWIPISFAELLSALGDSAYSPEPYTLDTVPSGIAIDDQLYDMPTNKLWLLVSGGAHNRTYLLTMWLNTVGGQKLEHEVRIKVKEQKS